jgi:hypothetical protein
MATYEQARRAKIEVLALLSGRVDLAGVGIQGRDDHYSLTVNLRSPASGALPTEIEGVHLQYEFIGDIRPLSH